MEYSREHYIATLIGCALGDMLGMPIEMWRPGQIQKYAGRVASLIDPVLPKDSAGNIIKEDEFGRLRTYNRNLKKGDYTDDTLLTLAIAQSIAEKQSLDLDDVAKHHLIFYDRTKDSQEKPLNVFGKTTREAFRNLEQGVSPLQSGVIGGPGNAPAMKMSPVGLYMDATGRYDEGIAFAEQVARMTHLDPRSIVSGIVQAHAIFLLLAIVDRKEFVQSLAECCETYEKPLSAEFAAHDKGDLKSRMRWIANNYDATPGEAFIHLDNSSLVMHSYPFAVFMFQKYWDNPIEGLIETVNFGGDCDTTGAIYGALCGAKNGMIFPKEWLREAKGLEPLEKAAKRIWELKRETEEKTWR
ncbi:MAG: ADP-ribosylglycohydrolase family protein [Nanoarchaeota archaeon]